MKKNFIYTSNLLILLLVSIGTLHLFALDPNKPINHYLLDEWGLDRGFPNDSVFSISQTPDGYLWLGTANGLVRYDGVKFETLVIDKSLKPLERWIGSLFVDKQGSLWMAGNSGLIRYKKGTFTTFTKKHGLAGKVILDITEDSYGNLWLGSYNNYLSRLKNGTFTLFDTSNGLDCRNVNTIYEDSRGVLWIAGNTGLFYEQGGEFKKYMSKGLCDKCSISIVYEDSKNVLWLGTDSGLVGIADPLSKKRKFKVFTTADGLADISFWSVCEDGNGNLWVGTRRALHRLRRESGGRIIIDRCLNDITVLSLLEDREGSLWIGTFHFGLKRLRDAAVKTYYKNEGLPPYKLTLYKDSTGDIWLGSTIGDLYRYKKSVGRFNIFLDASNFMDQPITAISEDSEGRVWVGTGTGGLFQLDVLQKQRKVAKKYNAGRDKSGYKITAIFRDSRDNLIIGTNGGGVLRYWDGVFTSYSTAEGLIDNHVTNIYEDSNNNIWLGTDKGLVLISNGQWEEKSMKTYLPGRSIQGIYEDRSGILWLGTFRSGLIRLKDGNPFYFNLENGLGSNSVFQILEDRRENLWLSTVAGILKTGKKELNQLADGRLERIVCTTFGLSDGMLNVQCIKSPLSSAIKVGEDEFWFATQKGISVVKPEKIQINKFPPPVVIESVLLNGEPVSVGSGGKIFYGIKNIRFSFTAPTFISKEKVKIYYMLKGYDSDWATVEPFQERTAYYNKLRPGHYRFMVTAANADGIRNQTGASFDFTLKLFVHQTLWFKLLTALLAVLAIIFGVFRIKRYLYIRKLKNKYKNSTLDPEKAEMVLKKLRYLMEVKKVFKDENLSRETLALKLGIPPRSLSQIMNEQLDKNFWEVVNGYRVEEAKKMLLNPGEKDYSILEIAFEVGFSSKEAFNRAFKKFTGKTPSQFKKGPAVF